MKLSSIIAGLTICVICCSACQPTPEAPIVVGKGDGALEETIIDAPTSENANDQLGETRWEENFELHGITCEVEADIVIPNIEDYPVYKFRKGSFDIPTAQRLVNYFTSSSSEMREVYFTKEDLLDQLMIAERGVLQEDGKYHPYEGQKEEVARLKEEIANAPNEEYENIKEISELPYTKIYRMPNGDRVNVYISEQTIQIVPYNAVAQAESWGTYDGEDRTKAFKNVRISEADAKEIAEDFIADVGIENMGIAYMEKGRLIEDSSEHKIISEGYYIRLARNDGGTVPLDISNFSVLNMMQTNDEDSTEDAVRDTFSEPWKSEIITLIVDESGVKYFSWKNPKDNVEILNENVALMSFDEIKKSIKKYIRIGYAPALKFEGYTKDIVLKIDEIVLTSQYSKIKDDKTHYMFLPVWIVYYSYEPNDIPGGYAEFRYGFGVNAIDGSVFKLE